MICANLCSSSLIRFFNATIFSSALSVLNFKMRAILISSKRCKSSRVTSRIKLGLYGSKRESMWSNAASVDFACSNCLSLYIRSSMNIFSKDAKCNCSLNSPFSISSSMRSKSTVLFVLRRNTSDTVMKHGLLSSTTQQFGE